MCYWISLGCTNLVPDIADCWLRDMRSWQNKEHKDV